MKQVRINSLLNYLPFLIVFAGSFYFFCFQAAYVQFYQEKTSLFVLSRDFLAASIRQPGSLLVYSGKFLSSFYIFTAAGALIISCVIGLIMYLISRIMEVLSGTRSILIPLLFGILFFILQTNYKYLLFNNLGILFQLLFFLLSVKYLRYYVTAVIFPFWFMATGSFAWIFALMFTFYIARKSLKTGWPVVLLFYLLIFLTIFLLKEFLLFESARDLFISPFSNEDTGSQIKILIAASGLLSLLPFLAAIKPWQPARITNKEAFRILFNSIVSVLLIVAAALFYRDKASREYFNVEKLFYEKKFNEIPAYLSDHPTTNRLTVFLNNIALCETGKLNDRFLNFPQSPDGQSLFLKWELVGEVLRRGGYFYYTTGMINEAHRWAYENMVMKGLTPEGLIMLIKTELINGNLKVAEKYIAILEKTLFYRKEAKGYRRLILNGGAVSNDPELGIKRKEMIVHDFFSITDDPYINIERALSADSLNRKAFEYKMAFLLLKKDYPGIASGLSKLENLGFTRIPVHLQEAAVVFSQLKTVALPPLGNLIIDPQVEARFTDYLQTFQQYGNDPKVAQPFLKQKFGNTFWYWAFYH